MFSGNEGFPAALLTAREEDVKPLAVQSAETLGLDGRQAATMDASLQEAWFCGVRMGHNVMLQAESGSADAKAAILAMQDEFQDLMERTAEALEATVATTIAAWDYLGRAWIAGAKFWKVEIAARLIESETGGFDEFLRRLED
jgi:hypothetical protein